MKSVCDKYGALFILDEVMSGMGRKCTCRHQGFLLNIFLGLGTLHAWETYGDGVTPDLQAIAKGLGGGLASSYHFRDSALTRRISYVSIGAILMSKRVADGIRDTSGVWKHGHTYQVRLIVGLR